MLEGELLARGWDPAPFTAAIADRTTELVKARGTRVFIDEPGGTMGATQVNGKLISWSISGNNNIHYKAFSEDENDYAANKIGFGEVTIDAQFTMEFNDDAEFARYRSSEGVQRLIRLERTGTVIHAASATPALPETRKRLRVDLYGFWDSWSPGDREGNMTATFSLAAYYDAVAGRECAIEVVNALATLP